MHDVSLLWFTLKHSSNSFSSAPALLRAAATLLCHVIQNKGVAVWRAGHVVYHGQID